MKKCIKSVITGALGTAVWLIANTSNAQPQDRPQQGNFDPQLMRQRMTERMRAQFDVKDDTEWKAISERIDKVMQARRALGGAGGPGGFGFPGGDPAKMVKAARAGRTVQADLRRKTARVVPTASSASWRRSSRACPVSRQSPKAGSNA